MAFNKRVSFISCCYRYKLFVVFDTLVAVIRDSSLLSWCCVQWFGWRNFKSFSMIVSVLNLTLALRSVRLYHCRSLLASTTQYYVQKKKQFSSKYQYFSLKSFPAFPFSSLHFRNILLSQIGLPVCVPWIYIVKPF